MTDLYDDTMPYEVTREISRKRRYELRVSEEVEIKDLVTGVVVRLSRVLTVQPLPNPS